MTPEERLAGLGLVLPPPPAAVAAYVPWQRAGNLLNGASELVNAVFQERGAHARTALGHVVMPLRSPVMVGFWAEIDT